MKKIIFTTLVFLSVLFIYKIYKFNNFMTNIHKLEKSPLYSYYSDYKILMLLNDDYDLTFNDFLKKHDKSLYDLIQTFEVNYKENNMFSGFYNIGYDNYDNELNTFYSIYEVNFFDSFFAKVDIVINNLSQYNRYRRNSFYINKNEIY